MEPDDITNRGPYDSYDPTEWEFHVRLDDGSWLARPEHDPSEPPANAPPFTRRLGDTWSFDTARLAERAAESHGAETGTYKVIPAPRDPGAWLAKSRPPAMAELAARLRAAAAPDEA